MNRGCILRNCSIYIRGNNNTLVVDKDCTIINGTFHFEDDNNAISIGEKTCISGKTELACMEGTQIIIGKDCLFSSGIFFRTGDSHSVTDLQGNRKNYSQDITIGDHVWIGQNVVVTKGSIVQDHSIVGVGSIVTRKFKESNVAIAGNPASVIKNNVDWDSHRL